MRGELGQKAANVKHQEIPQPDKAREQQHGDHDKEGRIDQFLEFCQNLPEPKECKTIEGADHFWWGYEPRLAAKVAAFFIKVL